MNLKDLKGHLSDSPLDGVDVLRAVVEVHGLAETLALIGELFGDAGREYPEPIIPQRMEAAR